MDTIILHIETATKVCSVALSKNGKLLDCIEVLNDEFVHGEKLTIFIEEILARNSFTANHLAAVSISAGPGSYTGLRIGVSVAKGLCYALKIPLISIDTLLSLASTSKSNREKRAILCMIDARRMEVFSVIFDCNLQVIKPLSADILEENTYSDFEPLVCMGDSNQKVKESWKNRDIQFDDKSHFSSKGQIDLAYRKFQNQDFEDVAYFEPFYLKDFIITSKKDK
jgi:tRNA threonylcarbamoyladenosine biosynthesis protein TsaB